MCALLFRFTGATCWSSCFGPSFRTARPRRTLCAHALGTSDAVQSRSFFGVPCQAVSRAFKRSASGYIRRTYACRSRGAFGTVFFECWGWGCQHEMRSNRRLSTLNLPLPMLGPDAVPVIFFSLFSAPLILFGVCRARLFWTARPTCSSSRAKPSWWATSTGSFSTSSTS